MKILKKLVSGRRRLRLSDMGMYSKPYKGGDHFAAYGQFSSVFYLKTNTAIEKM